MSLPFTATEFFNVFRQYNEAVWPAPLVLVVTACAALIAIRHGSRRGTRTMLLILSGLWLWSGIVYHGLFFRSINPVAAAFAVLFILQAALLLAHGIRLTERIRPNRSSAAIPGWAIVVYSLLVYPVLGAALGHRYPGSPTFGLPCPTTLFTIGVLLWLRPMRKILFVIPLLWAVIGTVAAVELGVQEDLGLAAAALTALAVMVAQARATKATGVITPATGR